MLLGNIIEMSCGQAQFRIVETTELQAPIYCYYSQANLEYDLFLSRAPESLKKIRTFDLINSLLSTDDVIFSLISGKAARVSALHHGFLYTQNYVKLVPQTQIDSDYLVYLLNENPTIQKQLSSGLQGSQVLKYTTKQLKSLKLPPLPELSKQQLIGSIYFKQKKLSYLKQKVAQLEQQIVLTQLQKVSTK